MSRKYFGTDGVRGLYGGPVINEAFAARLGFAAASWLPKKGRVLVGRDPRYSGATLEAAVARGLRVGGTEPVSLGVVPTPAVSRAVRTTGAVLGVVITASHNPAADNGIKFFGPGGVKLTDAEELQIEQRLPDGVTGEESPLPALDACTGYVAAMQALLPAGALAGWRVVLDTANGATCATSPVVLRALGAEVIGLGNAPDGRNINAGVGSEHAEQLAARVLATGARLGVAHDGDGDRCVLCDEHGGVLDGDEILTLLAAHALAHGRLAKQTLVVTIQSNLGVDAAIAAAGGRVLRTAVGDRYVIERMLAEGATLGGESSGHIICSEISPTGDGLVAALKVMEVMRATGRPLSELRRALKKFPQITSALTVRAKKSLESLPAVRAAIRALEKELGARGRVLVRYSGTEPKLRLLVEGPTDGAIRSGLARLEAAVRAELEVV
ncbi:MAG: phosphoglucosamine mutase [Opitutus sp.]|nr:phosphoglucosamine mutase [Opitutus sp.]